MEMPGALLNAEIAAQFLTLGGTTAYLYGYEPNETIQEVADCPTWGNLTLWLSGKDLRARQPLPTYYGARLLTQQWAQPGSGLPHQVYRAASNVRSLLGLPLVTAYAVHRPDGQWAVLLLNKDPNTSHQVTVRFQSTGKPAHVRFFGPCDLYQYSAAQYIWHPNGPHGYAAPDLPPSHRVSAERNILLPPFSLTVVRGRVKSMPAMFP